MSAFNFKARFEPMVLDWSKLHTIRTPRAKGEQSIGMFMYLYVGLRQPGARCLMLTRCVRQTYIQIEKNYTVWVGVSVGIGPDDRSEHDLTHYGDGSKRTHGRIVLDRDEKDLLAWRDGFRPVGSTLDRPGAAFDLMAAFWEKGRTNAKTDPLPFFGVMHHWNPKLQWQRDRFGCWQRVADPRPQISGYDARCPRIVQKRSA